MASSTQSQVYSFSEEHSIADINLVKTLADEEQQRRIHDAAGEKLRRDNANSASELFHLNVRPTWFQKGTAYTLNLLKVARNAGNTLLSSSQVRDLNTKIQLVGQKGVAAAQVVGQKGVAKAQVVGQKGVAKAQVVGQKGVAAAQDVKQKVQEAGAKATEVGKETALDVKDAIQGKLSGVAKKLKGVGSKFVESVSKAIDKIKSQNTSLAFAVLEEENERAYRMSSELQVFAMMNAFSVARLFKALAPEFYRPAWEPNSFYGTKLIEEAERQRRTLRDIGDRTASDNAKAVAKLMEHKFAATTPTTPALVAAKAEFVEEIKVHKPIPATM